MVLLLGVAGVAVATAGNSKKTVSLKGSESSGLGSDYSADWDAVDEVVDLSGLWGSIDTLYDRDPYVHTESFNGTVHLFWSKWNGLNYEIVHARRPQGAVWIGPEYVVTEPQATSNNVTPRAVVDELGILHVVWTQRDSFYSRVFHSARLSNAWTAPTLLSGMESASEPFPWLSDHRTMVDYQTTFEVVTVEVIITGYSGGSDDIDPSEVTVETYEMGRQILPR